MTTYDKHPEVNISGFDHRAWQGWEAIGRSLAQ